MQRTAVSMNRPVDRLLERLAGVRVSGEGYRADCPNGHAKARGTLSIRENPDGTVLMHCFACGDTPGVMVALDLTLADLYPRRLAVDDSPRARAVRRRHFRAIAWASALTMAAHEARIVQIAASSMSLGKRLEADELRRLVEAAERLQETKEVMHG